MSENNTAHPPESRWVEAEEVRKSLDSFEVPAPIPVETPVAQMETTPSAPEAPPQDTAPTDFDG